MTADPIRMCIEPAACADRTNSCGDRVENLWIDQEPRPDDERQERCIVEPDRQEAEERLSPFDIYTAFRLPDGTGIEDNPATPNVEVNNWGAVRQLMTPRLMKISVQFDF